MPERCPTGGDTQLDTSVEENLWQAIETGPRTRIRRVVVFTVYSRICGAQPKEPSLPPWCLCPTVWLGGTCSWFSPTPIGIQGHRSHH